MHAWILTNLTDCMFARLNYYLPSFLPPCHVSVCLHIGMSDAYIPNHLCLLLVVCCLLSDAFCLLFWLCLKLYAASCYCMPMCYLLPVAYFPPPVFCRLLTSMPDWCYCLLAPACCLYFYLLPNAACWLLCNDHFPLPPDVACYIVLTTLFTLLFCLLADPACCLIPNTCCLRQDTDTWWKYISILYLMLPYHLLSAEYC